MITFKQTGDFSKLTNYLDKARGEVGADVLDHYGQLGVLALSGATPVDTGKTSESWSYKVTRHKKSVSISFHNSNIHKGIAIAILLQYNHGTRNGGWVEGIDYINPAIRPIFNQLANDIWKEVTEV